jgi:hypothetical protein
MLIHDVLLAGNSWWFFRFENEKTRPTCKEDRFEGRGMPVNPLASEKLLTAGVTANIITTKENVKSRIHSRKNQLARPPVVT